MNFNQPDSIAARIDTVRSDIQRAEQAAGRPKGSVDLLAVSKTRSCDDIRQAVSAGCLQFGESYLQEAIEKIQEIDDSSLLWHFIGPIQSNKTQLIAQYFDWVHSIDRLKIAQRLDRQRADHLKPLQVCIQVNITGEDRKSGITAVQLPELMKQMLSLQRIQIRGLMTVPRKLDSRDRQIECFSRLRELLQQANRHGAQLDTLSMGMSNDLDIAIEQGATIVRVGSAIFGTRP